MNVASLVLLVVLTLFSIHYYATGQFMAFALLFVMSVIHVTNVTWIEKPEKK